jgi:predicted glutamine amidotransferase
MHFTYVTLFEGLITSYFEDSILKRAIAKELLHVDFAKETTPNDCVTIIATKPLTNNVR